jgi:hypothetical protein
MRCLKCGRRGKPSWGSRCSHCGHRCVAERKRHGIGDRGIQKGVDQLSANGTTFVLIRHVAYALRQGYLQRRRRLQSTLFGGPPKVDPGAWLKLFERFFEVNPNDAVITDVAAAQADFLDHSNEEVRVLLDRVLVCEDALFAAFLLKNLFPLTAACPVIGPAGDADPVFPGLPSRAKGREIDVFILHNLTPPGSRFASAVINAPEWFGGHRQARFIDIGLRESQREMLGDLMLRLSLIPGCQGRDLGGELAMVQPTLMLKLLGRCIEDRCSLDQLADDDGGFDVIVADDE